MNKLIWTLRSITLCCVVLPLLVTAFAYQDNVIGLLVPSQLTAALSGSDSAIQELVPDWGNLSSLEPTMNDDFQFNPEDGTFSLSINVTNPTATSITVDAFSLTITDENGTVWGTLNLEHPMICVPGNTATIPLEGTLSSEFLTLLHANGIDPADPNFHLDTIEDSGIDMNTIHLTNVDIDVGGLLIHIDDVMAHELLGSHDVSSPEE